MGSGPLAATRFGIVVLLVFGTLVAGVSAQVGGSISGTVKDPTGGVTPGVTVTAMNTVLGTQVVVVTDAQGFYSLPKLPVGRYDLTFQIEGFKPLRRAGVVVDTDAALQVNATLEIGSQSETVTVTANQIRVDTLSTRGTTFRRSEPHSTRINRAGLLGDRSSGRRCSSLPITKRLGPRKGLRPDSFRFHPAQSAPGTSPMLRAR